MIWGVEVREDTDGRPYRVASAERALLELAVNESLFGIDDVEECYRRAFELSAVRPDMILLRKKARDRGENAADQVYDYARKGRDVRFILDAHYLNRDPRLAENAIRKLEARTKSPN